MTGQKPFPEISGPNICLRRLRAEDAPALQKLMDDERVYRYLPAFLFEKQCPDARAVIRAVYNEGPEGSLFLAVAEHGIFRGLAELYGYREAVHKVSVGYRLLPECWGRGLATETLGLMIRYLFARTDTEIITASTMRENAASAAVLRKNGFSAFASAVPEDWGYDRPVRTDKWILLRTDRAALLPGASG